MKKFIPNRDRLLVELEPVKEKEIASGETADGGEYKLYAPGQHREQIRKGIVLAVGKPSNPEDEGRFNRGDLVVIKFYVGKIIQDYDLGWNDDCHRVVRYDEVLGSFVE